MSQPRGRIIGIDHLGVAVESAAEASRAYANAFGLVFPGERETLPEHGVSTAFHPLAGDAQIEFIEPLDLENSIGRFVSRRGGGVHHVALRVEGLDDLLAQMSGRGVELIDERARPGAHGTRVAFVHPRATGGVLIELVEHPQ